LYTEVFSLDSKTHHFNKAVDQVKKDPRCTELLGDSKKITAYGEPTWNKWARARPIAYVFSVTGLGREQKILIYHQLNAKDGSIWKRASYHAFQCQSHTLLVIWNTNKA
jgi:hypothetical protein